VFMRLFKPLSINDAKVLIRYARYAIMNNLGLEYDFSSKESEKLNRLRNLRYGIFVSIEKIVFSDGMFKRILRGSVGTLNPINNLVDDVFVIALHSAFNDPRFSPITPAEFRHCIIELTVISEPIEVNLEWLLDNLVLGYHGILIHSDNESKVILPQKMIEYAENYYKEYGEKLGRKELIKILESEYRISENKFQVFQTQIFYEVEPDKDIIERKLYLNRYFIK